MGTGRHNVSHFAEFKATKTFSALDGLRCASIVAVVWHHAAGHDYGFYLLRDGYLGVNLFFVISGFLITTLLLREREQPGGISLRRFYMRRSLRIFPLYYAVLLIWLAVVLLTVRDTPAGDLFLHNLPFFATFTQTWFVSANFVVTVIFYYSWSLAVEEQFYLLWSPVLRFTKRNLWPVLVASVLIVWPLLITLGFGTSLLGGHIAILASVPATICLGALLAHALNEPRWYDRIRSLLGGRLAAPLALVALLVGAFAMEVHVIWGLLLVSVLMVILVAACVVREENGLAPVLRWRPIAWIGTISYGMYLLHMFAINAVQLVAAKLGSAHPNPVLLFLVSLGMTIVGAALSYRYFESYFLRIKDRYFRSRRAKAAESAPLEPTSVASAAPVAPAQATPAVALDTPR